MEAINWDPPQVRVLRYSPAQTAHALARCRETARHRTSEGRHYRRMLRLHHGPWGAALSLFTGRPDGGVAEAAGNILLNVGALKVTRLLTNTTPNGSPLTGTPGAGTGYVGVGDGNIAPNTGQTALQGANQCYNAIDAGFPTLAGPIITVQSTFAAAAGAGGTWAGWLEWGLGTSVGAVAAATTSTTTQPTTGTYDSLINRTVPAGGLGSKGTAAAWVFTVTLSVS